MKLTRCGGARERMTQAPAYLPRADTVRGKRPRIPTHLYLVDMKINQPYYGVVELTSAGTKASNDFSTRKTKIQLYVAWDQLKK
jgi:hypothetical protein